MKFKFFKLLFILIIAFFSSLQLFASSKPKVYVGFYIKSLKTDIKEELVSIDFYYWYRFKLPKNKADISKYCDIEYVNGDISMDEIYEEKEIGNQYYKHGRIKGDFSFSLDYTNYPFDKQKILIQIEHAYYTFDQIELIPDTISYSRTNTNRDFWGISEDLDSKDIIINKSYFNIDHRVYETDFGDISLKDKQSSYSRLSYFINFSRNYIPYSFKFLIPIIIILSLSYLVFYIPAESLELACSLTVTSLLAAIAFQWTISDDLPNIGYLTTVDKIFYLAYLLIMLAMVQTVWTYNLVKNDNEKLAVKLELLGRWFFPILFICLSFYFILKGVFS